MDDSSQESIGSSRAAIERFRRRVQGTPGAVLRRNLESNVYGRPGSRQREIVEEALRSRLAETALALHVATDEQVAELAYRIERNRRSALRARRLAVGALVIALVAVAFALGWI